MKKTDNERPFGRACSNGRIYRLLNNYLRSCAEQGLDDAPKEGGGRVKSKAVARFPNVAGFCRYLKTGTDELPDIAERFPDVRGRILAILEDEALNAVSSPTIVTAYLKRRLGYDKELIASDGKGASLEVRFEHDIWEDGE
jgi:hypothetical protein